MLITNKIVKKAGYFLSLKNRQLFCGREGFFSVCNRRGKGFLLLEVLVSLTILSAGIMAVVRTYIISLQAQKHAQHKTIAVLIAGSLQEEIESALIEDLQGSQMVAAEIFTWRVEENFSYFEEIKPLAVNVDWEEKSEKYEVSYVNFYPKSYVDEILGRE